MANVVPSVWIPYPRPAASVELRCGVLYSGCQCVKRDGLQQDCPRSECQGRAACLDYPAPTCAPSGNSPQPWASPTDGRKAQSSQHYNRYKRQLDDKYLLRASKGYVDNPPAPGHQVPCRVHGKHTHNIDKH